jgi:hypothetical protein
LWPGVGETVVRNHERARRDAERAAEEERKKLEEERKRAEEEQAKAPEVGIETGESSTSADVGSSDGVSKVNKGKEKAV